MITILSDVYLHPLNNIVTNSSRGNILKWLRLPLSKRMLYSPIALASLAFIVYFVLFCIVTLPVLISMIGIEKCFNMFEKATNGSSKN